MRIKVSTVRGKCVCGVFSRKRMRKCRDEDGALGRLRALEVILRRELNPVQSGFKEGSNRIVTLEGRAQEGETEAKKYNI